MLEQAIDNHNRTIAIKYHKDVAKWINEKEIYSLSNFSSDYILKYLSCRLSNTKPSNYVIVTLYEENGNLQNYLIENTITSQNLIQIVIDISKGN